MVGGIYLIQGSQLVQMTERPYDSEDLLQRLLAEYPGVLAGDQMDRAAPRRWLLITREMAVPDAEGGAGRWSLDHLFLDQDGIPTLVEVKRRQDTRIRREVVGQLLDYAANAVVYWSPEVLKTSFEAACASRGVPEPASAVAEALGISLTEIDGFWQAAATNLRAGRVRLVFVADEIPPELGRIVEFLNGQMNPAEVLAVEVRQYVGSGDLRMLAARVIGGRPPPPPPPGPRQWDEASFFAELEVRRGGAVAATGRTIYGWAQAEPWRVRYGRGAIDGPLYLRYAHGGQEYNVASLNTGGWFTFDLPALRRAPAFAGDETRLELLGRLAAIPGTRIRLDPSVSYPTVDVDVLRDEGDRHQLRAVLDWVGSEPGAGPVA